MRDALRIILVLGSLFVAAVIFFAIVYHDRRPQIYFAAERGDTNMLAQYFTQGSNINAPVVCYPFGGRTSPLLDVAAMTRQVDAVDFLLKHGADPNLRNSSGDAPLLFLTRTGESEAALRVLKILIKAGADPNLRSSSGFDSPLKEAACLGESQMVSALLAAGADVHATNSDGLPALNYAANADVARLLISAGADRKRRSGGETPAETAFRLGNDGALSVLTNDSDGTNK